MGLEMSGCPAVPIIGGFSVRVPIIGDGDVGVPITGDGNVRVPSGAQQGGSRSPSADYWGFGAHYWDFGAHY